MTELMEAVKNNDVTQLQTLINSGSDVNHLEANGDHPLVMAAYLGHAEVIDLLLRAGADVGALDPTMKATALHAAAYAGRTEAARRLIEAGIEIDRQGPYNGYTALHDAIWQNNVETARVIIEAGADQTIKAHNHITAYELAKSKNHLALMALFKQT